MLCRCGDVAMWHSNIFMTLKYQYKLFPTSLYQYKTFLYTPLFHLSIILIVTFLVAKDLLLLVIILGGRVMIFNGWKGVYRFKPTLDHMEL